MLFENVLSTALGTSVGKKTANTVGRGITLTKIHSPEIYLVGGIAVGITAAVLFARAYKKHDHVMESVRDGLVDDVEEFNRVYTEDEEGTEDVTAMAGTVVESTAIYLWELTRLYGPSVAAALISIALITRGHGVMRGRNQALIASVSLFENALRMYRGRVKETYGEEEENRLYNGLEERVTTTVSTTEGGKKKKTKTKASVIPEDYDPMLYSRLFDETNVNYNRSKNTNEFFLSAQERYMNDILQIKGHVLLNDVYDGLAIPRSPEGAVTGWSLRASGDNYISYGLDADINRNPDDDRFLLDFNVNGVVFEHI